MKRARESVCEMKNDATLGCKTDFFGFFFLPSCNLFALMIIIIDAVNGLCMREFSLLATESI